MTNVELQRLINEMDVPSLRRDFTKPENLGWLVRNIGIRNWDHPRITEVVAELRNKVPVA